MPTAPPIRAARPSAGSWAARAASLEERIADRERQLALSEKRLDKAVVEDQADDPAYDKRIGELQTRIEQRGVRERDCRVEGGSRQVERGSLSGGISGGHNVRRSRTVGGDGARLH